MFRYILERIALAILALFIISIFTYTLTAAFTSTNPFRTMAIENHVKNIDEYVKNLEHQYHWDLPIIQRYFIYIGDIFSKGFWGDIYNPKLVSGDFSTIPSLFFEPLKYSIAVSLPAFVISAIIGIFLGTVSGYKRGTYIDSIINTFVLIFIALPSFVIAPIAINLAVKSGLPSRVFLTNEGQPLGVVIRSYITPITVVVLGSLAVYTSYTRNQVITVLTSNYILIAKTKGLGSFEIFRRYVVRNISIPLFSIIFPSYIGLLSGSIVIEIYWSIPGTSQVITNSFPTGEINIVMFNILFFTFLSLATEIVTDSSYVLLDPRIKYTSKSNKNYLGYLKAYYERRKLLKGEIDNGK
ncbi:ABC transporter permease [[Mycoplasma] gypis]|uniref:ABC transporter permease n=1 Tax=[Mycoplasma] gypis TaxID=92404 RepID=A0ABZ2RPN5_9BACT|nr:ABC transporter permease [[Mycoplasma] gypis]MBN0919231.1 ABC transporter permease [[Mycoplasma] gypis]